MRAAAAVFAWNVLWALAWGIVPVIPLWWAYEHGELDLVAIALVAWFARSWLRAIERPLERLSQLISSKLAERSREIEAAGSYEEWRAQQRG